MHSTRQQAGRPGLLPRPPECVVRTAADLGNQLELAAGREAGGVPDQALHQSALVLN